MDIITLQPFKCLADHNILTLSQACAQLWAKGRTTYMSIVNWHHGLHRYGWLGSGGEGGGGVPDNIPIPKLTFTVTLNMYRKIQSCGSGSGRGLVRIRRREEKKRIWHGTSSQVLTEDTGTELFQRTTTEQRSRTRQAAGEHGLSEQYARTDPRKHSFPIRKVGPWNRLSEDIKNSASSKLFKSRLKKYQAWGRGLQNCMKLMIW